MKLRIFVNLLAMDGSKIENGNIVIPIEKNGLYVKKLEGHDDVVTGVTASFVAWELTERSKYGDTHLLKRNLSKEQREAMTPEQLQKMPIMGRVRPIEKKEGGGDNDKAY